jgi:hypothetical protein
LTACSDSNPGGKNNYLVRVGNLVLTRSEFDAAIDLAAAAYPADATNTTEQMTELRLRLLEQMIEELVMEAEAEKLGIEVSDQELEAAVQKIKKDYPDNTFEETLIENAISFKTWKARLRKRLLKDKIVSLRLADQVTVTPADIERFYSRQGKSGKQKGGQQSAQDDAAIVHRIRIQKIETAYRNWIDEAKRRFPIEINETVWKEYTKDS